jgi:hypothetical protein
MKTMSEKNALEVKTHNTGVMGVYSGKRFDLFNVEEDKIDIIDISHSLSLICRFGGHIRKHYSVAQHSLMVEYMVMLIQSDNTILKAEEDYRERLHALLHDASEGYMGDIPRPLKYTESMQLFRETDNKLQMAINRRFGLPETEKTENIAIADEVALAVEGENLLLSRPSWTTAIRIKNQLTMYLFEMGCGFLKEIDGKSHLEIQNMFMEKFFHLNSKPYFVG